MQRAPSNRTNTLHREIETALNLSSLSASNIFWGKCVHPHGKLGTHHLLGFSTRVTLISTSFHAALRSVGWWQKHCKMVIPNFCHRRSFMAGYLRLQDRDNGHPWTCLVVRQRTTVLGPRTKIWARFSHNSYLSSRTVGNFSRWKTADIRVKTSPDCVEFLCLLKVIFFFSWFNKQHLGIWKQLCQLSADIVSVQFLSHYMPLPNDRSCRGWSCSSCFWNNVNIVDCWHPRQLICQTYH